MLGLPMLHRRARRLLPAGLATTGLLPPPQPLRWAHSALSRLPLGADRRGAIGLRLDSTVAVAIGERGVRWLCERAAVAGATPWRALPGDVHGFWSCRDDGALGLLVDARAAALWLLWQEPGAGRRGCCC